MNDWKIFTGRGRTDDDDPITRLPPPPPWRDFLDPDRDQRRGQVFRPSNSAIEMVNAALYLRRPLLVTGKPGTGKSTLARAVAEELRLELYTWPISTRTTLQDGLYRYDALARLRDTQVEGPQIDRVQSVGQYITLGPLGLALLPRERPAVLLIDEIDKGDIDLPNDLLHVFEEGEFFIPEITRLLPKVPAVTTAEKVAVHRPDGSTVELSGGQVRCTTFPLVIMTNNGERDFPPAFLRRCLRLDIEPPRDATELAAIVRAHLGATLFEEAEAMIMRYVTEFLKERDGATESQKNPDGATESQKNPDGVTESQKNPDGATESQKNPGRPGIRSYIATDQLLNLIYLATQERRPDEETEKVLRRELLRHLGAE